jgi:hypothetical protein
MLLFAVLLAVATGGCSTSGDDAATGSAEMETENRVHEPGEGGSSRAALARGVSTDDEGEDAELAPEIRLVEFTYEWRVSPKKGLQIDLSFENPHDTYERARGYVIVVAGYTSSGGAVRGVYPWNVELKDGLPDDYSNGSHLLFRREQEISAFIPYGNSEGYYDNLRLLIYTEEGELLNDQRYELDVTGAPTEVRKPKIQFSL